MHKRAFSVFNSAGMVSTVELSIDPPFLINDSEQTVTVRLPPNKRKILYATINITHEMVKNKEQYNLQFDKERNCICGSGELKTHGLVHNVSLLCKTQISLPKVLISKTQFDFGTGFIEDKYQVKLGTVFCISRTGFLYLLLPPFL